MLQSMKIHRRSEIAVAHISLSASLTQWRITLQRSLCTKVVMVVLSTLHCCFKLYSSVGVILICWIKVWWALCFGRSRRSTSSVIACITEHHQHGVLSNGLRNVLSNRTTYIIGKIRSTDSLTLHSGPTGHGHGSPIHLIHLRNDIFQHGPPQHLRHGATFIFLHYLWLIDKIPSLVAFTRNGRPKR